MNKRERTEYTQTVRGREGPQGHLLLFTTHHNFVRVKVHYLFKKHIPGSSSEDSVSILNVTLIFRLNVYHGSRRLTTNNPSVKQGAVCCSCYCSKKNFEKVQLKIRTSLLSKQGITLSNLSSLPKNVRPTRNTKYF